MNVRRCGDTYHKIWGFKSPKMQAQELSPGLFPPSIPQESLPLLLGNNFCYQAVLGKSAGVAWQHYIIELHIRKGREPAVLWTATLVILFSLGCRLWCPIGAVFDFFMSKLCLLKMTALWKKTYCDGFFFFHPAQLRDNDFAKYIRGKWVL